MLHHLVFLIKTLFFFFLGGGGGILECAYFRLDKTDVSLSRESCTYIYFKAFQKKIFRKLQQDENLLKLHGQVKNGKSVRVRTENDQSCNHPLIKIINKRINNSLSLSIE